MAVLRQHKPSGVWQVFRRRGRPTEAPAYTSRSRERAVAWMAENCPRPGRPRTTGGGANLIQYRVSDAQRAELTAEGPTANAAAKRRAFPEPDGASGTKETVCPRCGNPSYQSGECKPPAHPLFPDPRTVCKPCDGTGRDTRVPANGWDVACSACNGTGRTPAAGTAPTERKEP